MKNYLIILLTLFVQVSFGQITASKTKGCAPLTQINFTHPTTGDWDFGDGTSGSGTAVTHSYGNPGTYVVTVSQGGTIQDQVSIEVYGNPTPAFDLGGAASGCVPLGTSFTDQSTGGGGAAITGWQWTFGDGGSSSSQSPSYNFTLVGTFSVSLIVTDANGCDSSVIKKDLITVTNSPNASFTTTPSPASACTGPLTVGFNNFSTNSTGGTTDITYAWDFGNGQTATDKDPADVTYTTEGTYTVSLTVTETGGCSRTTSRTVTIGNPHAVPASYDTLCLNSAQILGNNSTGGTTYKWEFAGGPTYNSKNPFHTFSVAGDQQITLTTTSSQGCSDDTTFTIFVEEVLVDAISTPTYKCDDPYCFDFSASSATNSNISSYNWSFGVLQTKSGQNVQHCYGITDSVYYVHDPYYKNIALTVATTNGCTTTKTLTDTIYPVSAFFMPDVSMGCAPLTVNFSDSTRSRENIVKWTYDFGDGTTATDTNPSHTFTTPGEYTVVLIAENSFGCLDTSYPVTILVGEQIALDFSATPTSICPGDTVTFDDLSGNPNIDYWHYETNSNKSSSCVNSSMQTFASFDEVGMQDVTMHANYNGCISTETKVGLIEVKGPKGKVRYTGICATPLDYTFIGEIQGATSWDWDFGDGTVVANSTDSTVVHSYATSGNYTVKLITKNNTSGCSNDTAIVSIKAREIKAVITGDTVLCGATTYSYSAANSIGVQSFSKDCGNTYHWDTGDQSVPRTRTNPDITYAFSGSGTRTIRLIVEDDNGCRDTSAQEIKISNITAKLGLDKTTGCLPLAIAMSDSSVSDTLINKWVWKVDGVNYSAAKDTATTFVDNANHTIQLIVTDSLGCIDSAKTTIQPILPNATFSATTDRTICAGDSVSFSPSVTGPIASVNWTFGNVLGTSTELKPTFTFTPGANYDVVLEVTDTNGCKNTSTRASYVQVQDYPIALFMFKDTDGKDSLFCKGTNIEFTDTSIISNFSSRDWDLKNGSQQLSNKSISGFYDTPGIYDVELIVSTTFGCKDTLVKSLEVVGPAADFDMDKTLICSGETVTFNIKDSSSVLTYLWDFGDGTDENELSPVSHTFNDVPKSLKTNVQLILWGKDSICPTSVAKELNFKEVAAIFGVSDTIVCQNRSIAVTDSSLGADTYAWSITNNGSYNSSTLPAIFFSNAGLQTVELIVQNSTIGCTDTLRKEILVHPLPAISTSDKRYCDGDAVQLTAQGYSGLDFSWTPINLVADPDSANTAASPTETTDFTIAVVDSNSCTNSAVSNVFIQKQFDAITVDTCIVIGEKMSLGKDLGAEYTYSWEGTEADKRWLSCLDCPTQELQITEEVEKVYYTLNYNDTMGCFSNQIYYEICIIESYTFDVPSAFTPDGDGFNDIVYVRGHGIKNLLEFKIFNRWGELVFESSNLAHGWDGFHKTKEQGMETYIYKATVEFYNGTTDSKGGSITLIR